jgi:hypothetical protein
MKKEHIIGSIISIVILLAILYTAYQAWCKRFAGKIVATKCDGDRILYTVQCDGAHVLPIGSDHDRGQFNFVLAGPIKKTEDGTWYATTSMYEGEVIWVDKEDINFL